MRVAVADVGTNSSHLLIAESKGGRDYRVIDALKDRTRLGECLDSAGRITAEGERRLVHALSHFRELTAAHEVYEVRVYATSALREAPNGLEVAERMRQQTGIYPVIISGEREGQLTYLGASQSVNFGSDNLLLDLGGGSLELVRGDQQRAQEVVSLPLGAIRMTQQHQLSGSVLTAGLKTLKQQVQQELGPHLARFEVRAETQVLLSSGTAEAVAMALSSNASVARVNGLSFPVSAFAELLKRLSTLSPEERARIPGLERRTETIVAGVGVLHAALETLGARQVTISEGALREGMLIEELSQLQAFAGGLSARQRGVLGVAERYRVNLAHASQVAELSRQLFDALCHLGERFDAEARSLLTAAAQLHEVGSIVSQKAHHKHSEYLIRHTGLQGFSPAETEQIALITRYHRKSLPQASHETYMALSATQRKTVSRLSGILRVADGLDRSHSGQARLVSLRKDHQGWRLSVRAATSLDLEGAQAKADLWAREFGTLTIDTEARDQFTSHS